MNNITAALIFGSGSGGGGGGDSDYNHLDNLPKINGETLIGNKSDEDLGLLGEDSELSEEELNTLLSLI